jgi:lysozyme family protein
MAQFEPAIQKTLLWEGGYVNNPADPGGETKFGISKRSYPNVDIANLTVEDAIAIYRRDFWNYDGIVDQDVADKIFDLGVNVGKFHAVSITQLAAGVTTDGRYGPNTERAINAHPSGSFLPTIRIAAENYHKEIVVSHPQDAEFLSGWLKRDES